MNFRCYHYWRSSSSWRLRWALMEKGCRAPGSTGGSCQVEWVHVNLLKNEQNSPKHLDRNPMGLVPVLEVLDPKEGQGGPLFLSESLPTLEWLEEVRPDPVRLVPENPMARFQMRRLVEIINSGTQPLQNLTVIKAISEDPAERRKWSVRWIKRGFDAYEKHLEESAGKFSVGDELTLADLFLVPQCYNALRNEMNLEDWGRLAEIHERCLELENCRKSNPDAFKP